MKILFVCKWNRFRSRTAEAYFKKINKNKNIKADSTGIFQGSYPLDRTQVRVGKELGIDIQGRPKTISTKLLRKTNLIVIVANDVPKNLFNLRYQKLIKWDIPDVRSGKEEVTDRKIMKMIFKKVDALNKQLEKVRK